MRQRLSEPLTVEQMARHAGYSPRSFARRFRAETGTTPWQWLIGLRVTPRRTMRHDARALDLPPRDASSTARPPSCRNAARARDRGRARRTCCCCSSTRRSTRSAAAPSLATCRSARTSGAAQGIDVVRTPRGGKLTYHGPGQLVGYPIMRVDRHPRLRARDGGGDRRRARPGGRRGARPRPRGPAYTGVWVEDRKIASIGVHVSRGVSAHGFAINVDNDLEPFEQVVACGLPGRADDLGRARDRPRRAAARACASASPTRTPARMGCASASSRRARLGVSPAVPSLA